MKINSKNRGFAQGTMVLMADGKTKPIEQIKSGDYVLSFDENDADAPLEPMMVLDTFERVDTNVLEVKVGDTVLKVAQDQMFIGPYNDWKQVYNHSYVVDVYGNPVEYDVQQIKTGKHRIYDITVAENHSLIANGIRVHNAVTTGNTTGSTGGTSSAPGKTDKGGQVNGLGGSYPSMSSDMSKYGGYNTGHSLSGSGYDSNRPVSTSNTGDRASSFSGGGQTGQKKGTGAGAGSGSGGQKKGSGSQNGAGASATGGQSRNGGGGNTSRGSGDSDRGGANHGSRGVGGHGIYGNGQNASQKKVNNGAGGFKKKPNKPAPEPEPKPSGAAVTAKLILTIEDNIELVDDLLDNLSVTQLSGVLSTAVSALQMAQTFAGSLTPSIVAADMDANHKASLLDYATDIWNTIGNVNFDLTRGPLTAAAQAVASHKVNMLQTYVVNTKAILNIYLTNDERGNFYVTVDGIPSSGGGTVKPIIDKRKYKKSPGGKYTNELPKAKTIRSKKQSAKRT